MKCHSFDNLKNPLNGLSVRNESVKTTINRLHIQVITYNLVLGFTMDVNHASPLAIYIMAIVGETHKVLFNIKSVWTRYGFLVPNASAQ